MKNPLLNWIAIACLSVAVELPAQPAPPEVPNSIIASQNATQGDTTAALREKALTTIIESQEKTISQMALFFNGLAIIVGIASIVTPLLAYLLAIRPAQKITKEIGNVSDNMATIIDTKFQDYIQGHERRRIDSYLHDIEVGSEDRKQAARLYLSLNQHLVSSEEHILKIYTILSGQIDQETRGNLSYILTTKDSILSRHYFERVLREKLGQNYAWTAFSFFVNFGIRNSFESISSFFESLPQQEFVATLGQVGSLLTSKDVSVRLEFYNNREIIDALSDEKLMALRKHAIESVFRTAPDDFQSTYLARKTVQ